MDTKSTHSDKCPSPDSLLSLSLIDSKSMLKKLETSSTTDIKRTNEAKEMMVKEIISVKGYEDQ